MTMKRRTFLKLAGSAAAATGLACPAIAQGTTTVRWWYHYDNPQSTPQALIEAGVPEAKIICDYAGFRTLDSVARAKKVFGQDRILIISQRFHNERALYLAKGWGMDAIAFDAREVQIDHALKTYIREVFARVKAVLDLHLLHTQPKFLGPPVKLPE